MLDRPLLSIICSVVRVFVLRKPNTIYNHFFVYTTNHFPSFPPQMKPIPPVRPVERLFVCTPDSTLSVLLRTEHFCLSSRLRLFLSQDTRDEDSLGRDGFRLKSLVQY